MNHEIVGLHNQSIISAFSQERLSDGMSKSEGDIKREFVAASVAKLYLAASIFKLHGEGSFDLGQQVSITLQEFNEGSYGTGKLRFSNLPLALGLKVLGASKDRSVMFRPISNRDLLRLMVEKSDNLATLKIVNQAGRENVQQVLHFWGMKDTTVFNPQLGKRNAITLADMHFFLRSLQSGLLIGEKNAKYLKSWMQKKQVTNSELVPLGVHYKDGRIAEDGRSFFHNVGYIEGASGEYCFVILTEGQAVEMGRIPYTQELKVRNILKVLTDSIV